MTAFLARMQTDWVCCVLFISIAKWSVRRV